MRSIEVIGAWDGYVKRSADTLFEEIWHDHVKPPAGTPDPYKIEKVAEILKGHLWSIMDATHRERAVEQALGVRAIETKPIVSVVYVVLTEDRHSDVGVVVLSDKERAIAKAKENANAYARSPEDVSETELTRGMREDGWVYHATYSCEGDGVTVLRKEIVA